ncbi:nuclear transport factor 2 family protein [Paludisphaera rhizosphaerae]|nr:nuclear transport factor 2 family protein [Paludisphaera rhizosphaerae]
MPTPSEPLKPQIAQEQLERLLDGIDPALRARSRGPFEEADARGLAVVHGLFRAVGEGDFSAMAAMFHEEIELEITGPPSVPFLGAWSGRETVAETVRRNFEMLDAQAPEVVSMSVQGDHVVVILRERGRYIATDLEYSVRCAQVFTLSDGLVRRVREIIVDEPAD